MPWMWVLLTAAWPSIRPRVSADASRRRFSAKKRSVEVQRPIGHAVYREALGHCCPAGGAIDFADTADRIHGCIDAVDQEAGHARVDQLGHRSAVGGDDRRAAGKRLHDR